MERGRREEISASWEVSWQSRPRVRAGLRLN